MKKSHFSKLDKRERERGREEENMCKQVSERERASFMHESHDYFFNGLLQYDPTFEDESGHLCKLLVHSEAEIFYPVTLVHISFNIRTSRLKKELNIITVIRVPPLFRNCHHKTVLLCCGCSLQYFRKNGFPPSPPTQGTVNAVRIEERRGNRI